MKNTIKILLRMFRGGSHPRLVGLAAGLGLVGGLVAGWNFTFLAIVLVALVVNVPTGRFLATLAVGMIAAWLAEPLFAAAGYLALDRAMLGSLLNLAADSPLVAMFDLDRYALAGGLTIGIPIALGIGRLVSKRSAARNAAAPSAEILVVRPMGAPLCGVAIALAAWLPWEMGADSIERQLLAEMSRIHGAEVTADRIDLNLWTGRLSIENLEVPDVNDLDRNELVIGKLTAQVHASALVRGRLQVDDLLLEELRTDTPRSVRAQVIEGAAALGDADDLAATRALENGIALDGCLRHAKTIRRQATWLGKMITAVERLGNWERGDAEDRPLGLFAFVGASDRMHRSDLGDRQPLVYIRQMRAAGLDEGWDLGRKSELVATHLSSSPSLSRSSARIDVQAPEYGVQAIVEMPAHDDETGSMPQIRVQAKDVSLVDLLDVSRTDLAAWIQDGTATIDAEGVADSAVVQLVVNVEASKLRIKCDGEKPVAGLSPVIWSQGIDALGGLQLELALAGAWDAPQLHFDEERLVESFKQQLRGAGAHQVVQAAERETIEQSTRLFAQGRARNNRRGPNYKYPDPSQPRDVDADTPENDGDQRESEGDDEGGFAIAADSGLPEVQPTAAASTRPAMKYPRTQAPQDEPLLPDEPTSIAMNETTDGEAANEDAKSDDNVSEDIGAEEDSTGVAEASQRSRAVALGDPGKAQGARRNFENGAGTPAGGSIIARGRNRPSKPSALPGPINLVIGYDYDEARAQAAGPYESEATDSGGIRRIDPTRPGNIRPTSPRANSQATGGITPIRSVQGRQYDLPDDPLPQDRTANANRYAQQGTATAGRGTAIRAGGANSGAYGAGQSSQQSTLTAQGKNRYGAGTGGYNQNSPYISGAGGPSGVQGNRPTYPIESEFEDPQPEGNGFTRWTRSMGSKIGGIFKKKPRATEETETASRQNADPFQRQYRR